MIEATGEDLVRQVYEDCYRPLVVQMYGVAGDLAEAEEAVQEAFVRALAGTGGFFIPTSHGGYLVLPDEETRRVLERTSPGDIHYDHAALATPAYGSLVLENPTVYVVDKRHGTVAPLRTPGRVADVAIHYDGKLWVTVRGDRWRLFVSDDLGQSWTPVALPPQVATADTALVSVASLDEQTVVVKVLDQGRLDM